MYYHDITLFSISFSFISTKLKFQTSSKCGNKVDLSRGNVFIKIKHNGLYYLVILERSQCHGKVGT